MNRLRDSQIEIFRYFSTMVRDCFAEPIPFKFALNMCFFPILRCAKVVGYLCSQTLIIANFVVRVCTHIMMMIFAIFGSRVYGDAQLLMLCICSFPTPVGTLVHSLAHADLFTRRSSASAELFVDSFICSRRIVHQLVESFIDSFICSCRIVHSRIM